MSGTRWEAWAATMAGGGSESGVVLAHAAPAMRVQGAVADRRAREEAEERLLVAGATRSFGAGRRAMEEQPDPLRTCYERDRDRILHSSAFRRLAGKTQVFVFPADHQRTRLTHALEVAQVATAVARGTGLNVALAEAIALGHDCGHGPGGHASEDAFEPYLEGGFDHATWGADVVLAPLNLCLETLDGVRNHSWSRPAPLTPEGTVVSWADRCAYCAHDFEDAVSAGIVATSELPDQVAEVAGGTRSQMLASFVGDLVSTIATTGVVGMGAEMAAALGTLRRFNYERIYSRPESLAQGQAVVAVLQALVEHFSHLPLQLESAEAGGDPLRAAVAYVGGMTDRYAFGMAVSKLGWDREKLPRGFDAFQPVP